MDLTQIRYFLALARMLNFTRAAEACHVTQPALTKSIQRLEEELGGPLLLRERSLTQLTPLGQAMLPLLEQAFAAAERAKEHASGMKRQASPPLRVGLATDVPTLLFLPVFGELAARLPGFELSLEDASGAQLCEALLHGTLDAAVVTEGAALSGRLNRWPLFRDMAMLMMPPGHALDTGKAVPLSALDGTAVICGAADCRMARLLGQAQKAHGARPSHRYRVDAPGRAADLVRAGLGIALSTERTPHPTGFASARSRGRPRMMSCLSRWPAAPSRGRPMRSSSSFAPPAWLVAFMASDEDNPPSERRGAVSCLSERPARSRALGARCDQQLGHDLVGAWARRRLLDLGPIELHRAGGRVPSHGRLRGRCRVLSRGRRRLGGHRFGGEFGWRFARVHRFGHRRQGAVRSGCGFGIRVHHA